MRAGSVRALGLENHSRSGRQIRSLPEGTGWRMRARGTGAARHRPPPRNRLRRKHRLSQQALSIRIGILPSGSNSVGRVSASQAECRGFESRLPLHSPLCAHGDTLPGESRPIGHVHRPPTHDWLSTSEERHGDQHPPPVPQHRPGVPRGDRAAGLLPRRQLNAPRRDRPLAGARRGVRPRTSSTPRARPPPRTAAAPCSPSSERLPLAAGLRRAERGGIALDDLDLKRRSVRVTGKGGRVREVPFGVKAARAFDRYLRKARSRYPLATDTVEPPSWARRADNRQRHLRGDRPARRGATPPMPARAGRWRGDRGGLSEHADSVTAR